MLQNLRTFVLWLLFVVPMLSAAACAGRGSLEIEREFERQRRELATAIASPATPASEIEAHARALADTFARVLEERLEESRGLTELPDGIEGGGLGAGLVALLWWLSQRRRGSPSSDPPRAPPGSSSAPAN